MAAVERDGGWVVLGIEGESDEIERGLQWAREHGVRVDDATLGDIVEG